jgi:hypothetical protein
VNFLARFAVTSNLDDSRIFESGRIERGGCLRLVIEPEAWGYLVRDGHVVLLLIDAVVWGSSYSGDATCTKASQTFGRSAPR